MALSATSAAGCIVLMRRFDVSRILLSSVALGRICHLFRVVISLLWIPGVSRGATPGYSNGIPSGCHETGMPEALASGCGFVPQNIGGEVLMPRDCPEFSGGADPAPSGTPPGFLPTHTGAYTVAGHRGNLTLDLTLNHNLVLSAPARTGQGNPSQLGWSFVLQDAGDEWIMRLDCPEFRRPGRPGSGMRDPRESGALVPGWRPTRERGARASCALTGLTGFFDGITWACARRTRSSPGCHMRGLQPQSKAVLRNPAASGPRPAPKLKTPEYLELGLASHAETTDCEWVMSVKTSTYSRISRRDRDSVARSGHRQRSVVADLGLSEKRAGWGHPFRVVISLLWIPGVSRGATPGYSNGIPSGCARLRPTPHLKTPELPKWGLEIDVTKCSGRMCNAQRKK